MAEMFPNAGAAPGGGGAPQEAPDDGKLIDLSTKIDASDCYARNEASGFPMSNLFIGDSRLGCKSDADEQLIIHIAFSEFVKVRDGVESAVDCLEHRSGPYLETPSLTSDPILQVRSIKFVEFNNGLDPESNPSKVNLYVNRGNLGFEDCEDVDPTQTLHLTSEDLKESADPILLKYVKYQRVNSLTLFIEDNQGGEISALGGIKLFGRPVASTNMADFKKQQPM